MRVEQSWKQLPRGRSRRSKSFIAGESGAIAVLMGLALVAFLGIAALAVDYGYMCVVQGELQKAAEAGALSGADALGASSDPITAATSTVKANSAAGKVLTDCTVQSGYWSVVQRGFFTAAPSETPSPVPAIQVVVVKKSGQNGGSLPLIFAPILGVKNVDLIGAAVAILKTQGIWSILETGNGTVTINNNANVQRDVGICGTGTSTVNNNATVQGKIYLNSSTPQTNIGNNGVVQRGIQKDDSATATLKQASQAATTAYNRFVGLTSNLTAITKVNSTITITGSARENVLDVTNFTPSNNAIITLSAPDNASFVIRVATTFTLNNNSKVVLSGGITSDEVTFVYKGSGTVTLSNNSILNGSILSPNGAITLNNNASVNGGVLVSSKNIKLNNNSISTDKNPWLTASGGKGAALVQ